MFNNFCTTSCGLVCQESGQEVALKSITVNVTVGHMISHVESVLSYKNEGPNAIEALFKFPLDEGSAIYKMEAEIDGRRIVAECQEKIQAQQTYDEAKAKGMTAFLLREDENSGDIFKCFLGNLPSQKEAKLTIAYVSELQREINRAVKLTLPTVLNPRYHQETSIQNRDTGFSGFGFSASPFQQQPDQFTESGKGGYSFSLTISIQSQFRIDKIESETPELTVSIEEPDKLSAQATYATEDCKLSTDLTLYIQYEDDSQPTAIIERGSAGQDGIMKSDMLLLNFYPEFQEITSKCGEFIFVIDRSGSMAGSNILNAVQTLMLLVKSLRVGCYFNIVSFGSSYSTLFQRSVIYNKENMAIAVNHISSIEANMGGTELNNPLLKVFSEPLVQGHPRQLFVLTDGAINNVNQTLELVKKNSKKARVFSVGIGQGASTALVKGLARAGHGRYEFVQGQDRLQQKVMGLMKFSLQPELTDLTLGWNFSPNEHVSAVTIPEKLPTVFVGEMVTLYAIITGAERQEIVGGTVKITGNLGELPFEYLLEFEGQGQVNETTVAAPIHRLAAKAFVKDLEIEEMANDSIDKKSDIVLVSVAANIISKYTSFVGVDKDSKVPVIQPVQIEPPVQGFSFGASSGAAYFGSANFNSQQGGLFGSSQPTFGAAPASTGGLFGTAGGGSIGSNQLIYGGAPPLGGGSFGSAQSSFGGFGGAPSAEGGLFGSAHHRSAVPTFGGSANNNLFGNSQPQGFSFGGQQNYYTKSAPLPRSATPQQFSIKEQQQNMNMMYGSSQGSSLFGCKQTSAGFGGGAPSSGLFGSSSSGGFDVQNQSKKSAMFQDEMIAVISLQDFEGSWTSSDQLIELIWIPQELTQPPEGIDGTCWMTCLVLAWLEYKQSNRKDEWELLYKKAADWLISEIGAEPLATLKTLALEEMKQL
ncbi:unnamed protein product [Mytilus edulis]|uniref:Uncharacterized protein n=1 Tax=Mytilus edulis TaxID=6550 RepID=A0A8S3QCU7_MYTED|nr:unnamed protein product [Mytilus edulis]